MLPNRHNSETGLTQDTGILSPLMITVRHLLVQEMSLRPSGEWTPGGSWTVVRVAEGAGYCLQTGAARELNAGDMVVAGPHAGAVFRASQLGVLKLEYYHVLPQCLNGLLTVTEWRQLEDPTSEIGARLQFFAATDAAAQKFTRLAAQTQRDGLSVRSALLQLWASSVTNLLPVPGANPAAHNLRERFRQFVGKMSEAELAVRSLAQLAGELHCSERHFSRLFREEFSISLRARQTELRLQRARQLLAESDAKIINVAYESGYRHLGLFNAMFKRRFGVTPSQWRQENLPGGSAAGKRSGLASILLLVLLFQMFFSPCIFGQTTNRAAAKAKSTAPHFTVKKYLVEGNTVLSPKEIGQILTNVPSAFGTNVDFEGIRAALGELQMAYRERGYVTVSVGLPQQRLTNAEVKIKVTEGKLVDVRVQGNKWFSTPNVLRALPSLHTNMLLNSHIFQGELDQANANRDRQIYPVIGPGPDPGTTELTLKVKDRLPLHSRVEYNDISTPGTPYTRAVFSAEYDNLWQMEHQVGVSYTFTPFDFHDSVDHYWWPLDKPLIGSYSIYYRMPLGSTKSLQEQIDQSTGHFGYNEVTHQFQLPPPSGRPELTFYASRSVTDTGVQANGYTNVVNTPLLSIVSFDTGQNITVNENVGTKLSWPLPQLGPIASTLTLGADFKHFSQISYNSNNFAATTYVTNSDGTVTPISSLVTSGQQPQSSEIYYVPVNIGINGSIPDPWGTTFFNAQANVDLGTFGGISVPGSGTNAVSHGGLSEVSFGRNVKDHYITLQMGADRLQRVYKDWSIKLHADGQWANGGLFSNEQFAMGGINGVRGYQDGIAYGDAGWRVSIEPQTPLMEFGMVDGDTPLWLRSSVFVDYGQSYLLDNGFYGAATLPNGPAYVAVPGHPSVLNFLGAGWSLSMNVGNHLDGRFTVAFPLMDLNLPQGFSSVGDVRFYFALGAQF